MSKFFGSSWYICIIFQNLSVSDVTSDHTKKVRNVTRSASSASTDSGVIGQEESHDSQQSSPSNTLTRYQRSSWSEFRRVTGTQPHLSASCSDLSKAEVRLTLFLMGLVEKCHMTQTK